MTPKEKAEQLIDKMYNSALYVASKYAAKQCALIAVEEIFSNNTDISKHDYWIEVKEEIENL